MSERSAAPTIRDVAELAGVSTATVSRVMAGLGSPRPATAEAVRHAVATLGYRPSGVARSLRMRRTQSFGLIVSDIQTPYFPELVDTIAAASRALDYSVILGTVAGGEVLEYLELMVDRGIDGLILASGRIDDRVWSRVRDLTTPVVVVNSEPGETPLPVPFIATDHAGGLRAAVGHLARLGHRRIAYVTGPGDSTATGARLAGFEQGCDDEGLERGDCPVIQGGIDVPAGAVAFERLLEDHPEVTAVATYNDLVAIGILRALHDAGGTAPDDLSIIGFDDIAATTWVTPPLTTLRQEKDRLGRLAVERLMALIDGSRPAVPGELVRVPAPLVVRGSTGAPRRAHRLPERGAGRR